MRRLFVLIVAVLAALLGSAVPSTASPPIPTDLKFTHLYTYDGHNQDAARTHYTAERGPPSTYGPVTAYLAADCWSRGASARSDTTTPALAVMTYDDPTQHVQVVYAGARPPRAIDGPRGAGASVHPAGVAAKTAPKALNAASRVAPWAGSSLSRLSREGEVMYRVYGGGAGKAAAQPSWGWPGGGNQVVFGDGFHVPSDWIVR